MSLNDDGSSGEKTLTVGSNKEPDLPPVYQLSNSDGPGQMLIGEALSASNYGEWVLDMKDALIAKNKFRFVDGTLNKPSGPGEREAWIRCDAMVKGWLKTAMDKEIRSSIRFAETAREIWADLHAHFGQGSSSRAYELRRLISMLQQEKHSVSAFYTKLRAYWEEASAISPTPVCTCGLCTCGVSRQVREQQDNSRLFDFLMGLDDAFAAVRSQVLAMRPIPSLSKVFNIALNEEQQKAITQNRRPSPEAAAFNTRGETDRSARSAGERERVRCTHCQKTGHLRENCYELVGYPPRDREKDRDRAAGDKQQRRRNPRGSMDNSTREPKALQADAIKALFRDSQ
ncbi:unnamed protein product [Linum trigynum]|uniref:Retrotransposon Copia-like N-terminal domain-containing protein n=1 Tax=Linum trigynum TaxID=586398 RepID=A0AAV2CKY4_9ROSI